ncbi:NUDIX hydrolase [Streptacidiphilus jiangxiensis]|uniref:NUDIX domain-containing protein n=1 Tax=Streptacidiphilus jiangxiensis TaxID=235985 RepID=A0A1H8B545_STRJI|nr:NUDIX hydrolase [Streptacidiphilus jiangxiensis]SEM77264.1 NUDIX domain-containing protein [Streptacidiphilus jiangxiensis]
MSTETPAIPVRTCVAIVNRGEVCLIRRSRADGDQYSVPGGLLDTDEEVPAALARELKEELDLDVTTLGVAPVLCWEQHQATTRAGGLFQRRHLIHVLQAPDHVRDLISATEQDAEDDTQVVWLPTSQAAALHLYPDIGTALAGFNGVPIDVAELPPMHDGTYAWR